jgi:hypothetical protein
MKVEAGFADAIKRAPTGRKSGRDGTQRGKWARFPLDSSRETTPAYPPTRISVERVVAKGRSSRSLTTGRPVILDAACQRPQGTGLSPSCLWRPRHSGRINVLLCIVKGFALAKPLCCPIK